MEYEYRDLKIIKSEIKRVDPEEAQKMLELNLDNRKIRSRKVQEYAGYMKNGLWRENGETVLITKEGYLLNGQHRLHAVISSGTTQNFLIATVKETDGKGRLTPLGVIQDRGSARNHSDITGVPGSCDQISATMIRHLMNNGGFHANNTMLRAAIYDVFESEMNYHIGKCGSSKRHLSRTAIRSAFVLRYSQGYDHTDNYHTILTDMVGLPVAWMNWYERVQRIETNHSASRDQLLVLTWVLTEPDRDMSKKIMLNGNKIKESLKEIKDQFHYYALDTIKKVLPNYEYKS